jgi:DNA gyrase/topoisomerase IV subunit B
MHPMGEDHVIQTMSCVEAIRRRPGMYIGDPQGSGLYEYVRSALAPAFAEFRSGHHRDLAVTIHADDAITIADQGTGIPVTRAGWHESALQVYITTVVACGSGRPLEVNYYGLTWVNAVSEFFAVDVHRDGCHHRIRCERGVVTTPVATTATHDPRHGTTLHFRPDPAIFGANIHLDPTRIREYLWESACLHPGLRIAFDDQRAGGGGDVFLAPRGLSDYLERLNQGRRTLTPIIQLHAVSPDISIEIALQGRVAAAGPGVSFVNDAHLWGGGTHVLGVKEAWIRAVGAWMKSAGASGVARSGLRQRDLLAGMSMVIAITLERPLFNNPTRQELINPEVRSQVFNAITPGLRAWCAAHPREMRTVVRAALRRKSARK